MLKRDSGAFVAEAWREYLDFVGRLAPAPVRRLLNKRTIRVLLVVLALEVLIGSVIYFLMLSG